MGYQGVRFLLAGALLCATAPSVWAASSGQITITASVPAACDISVSPTAGANITNLTLGATNLQVANVTEACNSPNGYTVDMVGSNSGDYTGRFIDSVSGDSRDFTIKYDGNVINSTRITDVNAPNMAATKTLQITIPVDHTLTASTGATYTETLDFTITAK